ncbi:MAG TPA: Dabb family protein [Acetobacteraceae bacterium]|nr:Dabb family protein [Acetobacteraceae bacterium]
MPPKESMIRHIVFFRARRPEDVDAVLEGLSLLKRIPHASRLEVVANGRMDQIANDVDVVVYGEFADRESFAAYKAHPIYEESIRRVRPLRDLRLAADFEVPAAPAA